MADAESLFAAGDLLGARAALAKRLRASPGDAAARMFFLQLLTLLGDYAKARAQAEVLAEISPEARMLAVLVGQLAEAEGARELCLRGEAPIELLAGEVWNRRFAAALTDDLRAWAQGSGTNNSRFGLLDDAPDTPGRINGRSFDWVADADSRFGPHLEAVIGGRYGLLPFSAVQSIMSVGPKDLRDTVWLPCEISLRNGPRLTGFLPVRYPGTTKSGDPQLLLGRRTEWYDGPGGDIGMGQRLLALSDDSEIEILGLRQLDFDSSRLS